MKKNNSKKSLQGGKREVEMIQVRKLECLRCGHKWIPRIEEDPIQCPACHNVGWNKPRRNPSNKQK